MKNRTLKNLVTLVLIAVFSTFIYSFMSAPLLDDWKVPAKFQNMKNPTDKADKENLNIGKSLYMKHCKSCHGKTGLGDGTKADELDTPCGDFSADLNGQTDGALFYKIKTGKDEMPSFEKKKSDDEDIWLLVNIIRTIKGN